MYEWCEDDWHSNYTGAPTDGSAWIDSPRVSDRMIRGSYWYYAAWCCRSAFRNNYDPSIRAYNFGIRVAAVP